MTMTSRNQIALLLLSLFSLIHAHTLRTPVREGPLDGLMVSHSDDNVSPPIEEEDMDEKEIPKEDDEEKQFFCNHIASCGIRTNPGPPTQDSTYDGYECICRGEEQLGLSAFCYSGICYNPDRDEYRSPDQLDKEGLCQYTVKKREDVERCLTVEESEKNDPNLRYFTDPPALAGPEDQKNEMDAALKMGQQDSDTPSEDLPKM